MQMCRPSLRRVMHLCNSGRRGQAGDGGVGGATSNQGNKGDSPDHLRLTNRITATKLFSKTYKSKLRLVIINLQQLAPICAAWTGTQAVADFVLVTFHLVNHWVHLVHCVLHRTKLIRFDAVLVTMESRAQERCTTPWLLVLCRAQHHCRLICQYMAMLNRWVDRQQAAFTHRLAGFCFLHVNAAQVLLTSTVVDMM